MSINRVMLLGRLGQDPEIKYTPSGSSVCSFSVATSEAWTDKANGQKQEKTEWHRVIVWGKKGEVCHQYLKKGRQVFIEGRIQTRSWDDKNGGGKRYATEILAMNVQFVGSNGQDSHGAPSADNSSFGQYDQDPMMSMGTENGSNNGNARREGDYKIGPDIGFTADDIPF